MSATRFRIRTAALAAVMTVLAACGGGGDSAAPAGGANNGGGPAGNAGVDQNVVVTGVLTGFGSVYVNGLRYETSNATFNKDGQSITQSGLRIGQVVHVRGRHNETSGRAVADSVRQDDNLEGPITAIDAAAQTFVVLAHTVRVTPETSFDDSLGTSFAALTVGLQVEVSGLQNAAGDIIATRIEKRSAGATTLEIQGKVSSLDATSKKFNIDRLVVNYSSATLQDFSASGLANGQTVEVKGNALNAAGELVATRVELRDLESAPADAKREIEGLVTRYVSATDFDVAGRAVTTTSTTRYENGAATDIALNVKLEAEGSINAAGVLVASKIQFKRANHAGLEGVVDSVTANASGLGGTLTVLGVTITVDDLTRMEDKSRADLETFRLSNLSAGDYVKVRGTETAALRLSASRLERDDAESDAWVRGTARDLVTPNLTVLGVPVTTSASTVFEELTAAEFFANASGRVVKAKGTETNNTIAAREIEFEDSN